MRHTFFVILALFSFLQTFAESINKTLFKESILSSQYERAWDCYNALYSIKPNDAVMEAGILYVCLRQNNLKDTKQIVSRLEKLVSKYLGMYESVYSLYINTCINDLDLNIGREEAEVFLKTYENEPFRVRAKKAHDVAEVLASYHDYEQAVNVLDFIRDNKSEIEPTYYYRYLNSLAMYYNYCQNPQMAYVLQEQCAGYYKDKFGTLSWNYAKMLTGMAYVARFTNKPNLELLLKVDSIYRESGLVETEDYAINLDNIGTAYSRQGNFIKARDYCNRAYDLMQKMERLDSIHIAITLNNIGNFIKHNDIKDSKKYFLKSISTYPTAEAILNLANIYENEQDYEKAHELYDQLSDYNRKVFSNVIAYHLAKSNRWDEYFDMINQYLQYLKILIKDNVRVMPEAERSDFVEYITNSREIANLFEYACTRKDATLSTLCYDYLLMTKSLLLQFKDNIDNLVLDSGNEELQDEYNTLNIIKINVDKGLTDLRTYKQKEFDFLEKLKSYGSFVNFIDTRCFDVASNLSESEVCVEFFMDVSRSFKNNDYNDNSLLDNSICLYAVCLLKDSIPIVINTEITREQVLNIDSKTSILVNQIYNAISPIFNDKKKSVFFPHLIFFMYILWSLSSSTIHVNLFDYHQQGNYVIEMNILKNQISGRRC